MPSLKAARPSSPPTPLNPFLTPPPPTGHSKRSDNNLHVYSSVYGDRCVGIGAQFMPVAGFQEVYVNNTCIVGTPSGEVFGIPFQDAYPPHTPVATPGDFQARFISGGNTIHMAGTPRGLGPFPTFQDFIASGYEIAPSAVNTTLPSADEIVAWGRSLLMGGGELWGVPFTLPVKAM